MRAKHKKHPRLSPNSVINSLEFFIFSVIFLKPLIFSIFLPSSFFEFLFMLYTMISAPFSPYTCESGFGGFNCPISHLLEPSTISCKAACLLFRHYLHVNAARELVGKYLMWRQHLLQIFVIFHPHPLSNICQPPYREIPLIYYIKGMRMFLATSDRSFKMNILLGYG